jgi:large subunit ribosomal protein L17
MRHRIADYKLNRTSNQRRALLHSLLMGLVLHRQITTTPAKAKMVRRVMERLVTQAKSNTLGARRLIQKMLADRMAVNILVDEIAPALNDRSSGYVTVSGETRRRGDNVLMTTVTFASETARTVKARPERKTTKPVQAEVVRSTKTAAAPKKK